MISVALEQIPNQSFSARFGSFRYDIVIKETAGVMSISIARNNVQIVENHRLVGDAPVIPYRYQEEGNFALLTENEELPYYTFFGVSQFLYYLDDMELATIRSS